MAEVVDSMPPQCRGNYPWGEWLDGRMRKLKRDTDYEADEALVVAAARAAAKRRNMQITTSFNRRKGVVYLHAVSSTSVERSPNVTE